MFGKKKKQILEQAERIKALEAQAKTLSEANQKMKDRMDDVERREKGIGRAISEATVTVDNMISDAQRKAGVLLDETKAECDTQRKKAERVVEDAYRSAREIIRESEDEAKHKQAEMQLRIEQYAALLNGYDTLVQEQLQMARDGARRFAELSRALHEAIPQLLNTDGSPMPGLSIPEPMQKKDPESPAPDPDLGEEPLVTVNNIAKNTPETPQSNVDEIIDGILAAAEEQA